MRVLFSLTVAMLIFASAVKGAEAGDEVHSVTSSQDPVKGFTTDFSEQSTWLLGYTDPARFRRPPHHEWFFNGYDQYSADSLLLAELREAVSEDLTIKVVLGTWCPDSRREVPKFMKISDLLGIDPGIMTFIGVDDAKISPVGEYEELGIERVPTFIFYKNNVEAGRIIENPVSSLEQDMLNILTGKK
ncbi:MAG: thioredoxin family protein [Bacteroidales bacterium]|jgi:thiol-disulfide isomerase/thioredoxin|nr:thioredoxin family protein [Bacteroidales bacterium]